MKLSEYKGEAALDLLAEIIEPASEIMTDEKVQELITAKNKAGVAKALIKEHKSAIIEILAAIDGVPVDEYEINVLTLPLKIIELLNDEELTSFFISAEQMEEPNSSIAPTETTTEKKK